MRNVVNGLRSIIAAAALTVVCLHSSHAGVIYDLNADWSNASNPNGPWTYREGSNALPFVSNWTPLVSSTAQPAWAPGTNAGNFLPAWFEATSANFDWQIGDVVVHTTDPNGASSGIANVLFTAPTAGTADISGLLWNARDFNRPQAWSLFVGSTLLGSGLLPGNGSITRANPTTFNFSNVNLSSGDAVILSIFRTGAGGDYVGTNLSVNVVPEPSTVGLIGLGLLGLGAMMRRRRNS